MTVRSFALVAALGTAFSAVAFAHPIVPVSERPPAISNSSRSDVTRGLDDAVRSGRAPVALPADLYPAQPVSTGRSRADVRRERDDALRNGTAPIGRIAYPGPLPSGQARTREDVLHELDHFRADPTTDDGWRYVGSDAGWEPGR